MISEANQVALQAAGLSFILGARIPFLPDVVREWRDKHPDETVPDQLVLTQPWPATVLGEDPRDPGSGRALPVPPRPGPANIARDRRTGRQSPACRRRTCSGETESVHQADRGDQEREPRVGGQDPRPGRLEGLHHQPGRPDPPTSSSARITSCGASRRPSGCPSTTCRPARSTTAPATPSTLT